jgi:hypothetical protein
VTLEVAVQVTLVGEMEFVHQVLKAFVCVYEVYLQLNDGEVVYNLFGVLSACALADGIKVPCGYSHFISVILHRPVFAEVVGEQYSEFVEQFVFAFAYVLFCQHTVRLAYVLNIEQQ